MFKNILLTQCLQQDFVKPIGKYDPLPNFLHIGYLESRRLMGLDPAVGPIAMFMNWAYSRTEDELDIIHIRDWHDDSDPFQQDHMRQFGPHCIRNSQGAELAFQTDGERKVKIINSRSLNDFVDTKLGQLLAKHKHLKTRVGIIGVWTEAKVTFLAYDIKSRFPDYEIGICSALTASSSKSKHYFYLDQLKRLLGVRIFDSVGEFIRFLGGEETCLATDLLTKDTPVLTFVPDTGCSDTDLKIIRFLFRESSAVTLKKLGGGYSGSLVFGCNSIHAEGMDEVPHVVKLGEQVPIGRERRAYERIEEVLGNNAPRIVDFIDFQGRGGIKYRYASMDKGKAKSFKELYSGYLPMKSMKSYLNSLFIEQLGRLYGSKALEQINLLRYYCFDPDMEHIIRKQVEWVYGRKADSEVLCLPGGREFPNPWCFYRNDLAGLISKAEGTAYFSYIHGDLNGANIVVDSRKNVWVIDFSHTHRGHILRDLLKLENDLLYIFTPFTGMENFDEALRISEVIFNVNDLAKPLPPLVDTGLSHPGFKRAYETLRILRSYYPALIEQDRSPLQAFIGLLRYSMHTLAFEESGYFHKQWALYNSGHFCRIIRKKIVETGPLRINWIMSERIKPGSIGMTILPGRKDYSRSLEEDLLLIRKERISHILILLTTEEMTSYGVPGLIKRYSEAGLTVQHFPITDQKTTTVREMKLIVNAMDLWIAEGKKVLVHCVGGLGRSGMVVASYLKYKGYTSDEAIRITREARSPRAIETKEQEEFVRRMKF